jgi:hypothetical protein
MQPVDNKAKLVELVSLVNLAILTEGLSRI